MIFVTKCPCNSKNVCNICSCLAALKHLKFIVCGPCVKQVWPPLLYSLELLTVSWNKLKSEYTHVFSDLSSWTITTVWQTFYRNVIRSICHKSSRASGPHCRSMMNDGKNQSSVYSPHQKFDSDLEDARIGIWEFNEAANKVVRHSLRHWVLFLKRTLYAVCSAFVMEVQHICCLLSFKCSIKYFMSLPSATGTVGML
jgi:hypothetical protein